MLTEIEGRMAWQVPTVTTMRQEPVGRLAGLSEMANALGMDEPEQGSSEAAMWEDFLDVAAELISSYTTQCATRRAVRATYRAAGYGGSGASARGLDPVFPERLEFVDAPTGPVVELTAANWLTVNGRVPAEVEVGLGLDAFRLNGARPEKCHGLELEYLSGFDEGEAPAEYRTANYLLAAALYGNRGCGKNVSELLRESGAAAMLAASVKRRGVV